MLSNYPPGSMKGSGIYSWEYEEEFECGAKNAEGVYCDFLGMVVVDVDDWGTRHATCPKCGHEDSWERSDPDDEYEPDRY